MVKKGIKELLKIYFKLFSKMVVGIKNSCIFAAA